MGVQFFLDPSPLPLIYHPILSRFSAYPPSLPLVGRHICMVPNRVFNDFSKIATLRELNFVHNIFRAELFFAHLIFAHPNKAFSRTIFFAHLNAKNSTISGQNWGFWPVNLKRILKELLKSVEIFPKFHIEVIQNWVWNNNWKFCHFFNFDPRNGPFLGRKFPKMAPFLAEIWTIFAHNIIRVEFKFVHLRLREK